VARVAPTGAERCGTAVHRCRPDRPRAGRARGQPHLASYVATREPGRSKLQAWAQRIARGPLTLVPNLHDWALEEFLYHGAPGDDWQPLEAYLAFVGPHLSEAGQAKLRQWRQAEPGAYRLGAVQGQTVRLQRWDVVRATPLGEEFAHCPSLLAVQRRHIVATKTRC
jgi:hypothetical protein